ncbi:hypothetical protein BHE74_00005725 [Ensete ventricosum]|nr:hypothetical protein BHE74_00005725 [Ensete ventricosum]
MAKHRGESSKMGQARPLPQVAASGLQVQTCSQTAGAAHEEREVGYSLRVEEAQYGAPTRKRSHKERLSMVETRLDVLEASLEGLYQGQGRLLGVESSQEEVESWIDRVESLVDRLTEDTKDSWPRQKFGHQRAEHLRVELDEANGRRASAEADLEAARAESANLRRQLADSREQLDDSEGQL